MILVCHHEAEVSVVRVKGDLNSCSLIIRPCPCSSVICLEQNQRSSRVVRARILWNREPGICQHGDSRPFREVAVECKRTGKRSGGISLLSWLNVIGPD